MGRRTNLRLAQSKPPPSQGFRGFDRQRQNLGLHRLRAAAHQEISLPITLLIRLRFGHLGFSGEDPPPQPAARKSSASGFAVDSLQEGALGPPSDRSMQTPGIAADRDTGGADWREIDENGSNGLSGVSSVNARRSARGWEAGGELGEIANPT